ncbi:MAG TPA: VCBS repeat-containing protein, partial [Ilumatobacter sp.]
AALQQYPTRLLGTYLNDGTGAFGPPSLVPLAPVESEYGSSTFVAAGDIDGDGDADAVATDVAGEYAPIGAGFRTVALVAVNDGTGTFTPAASAVEVGPPDGSHRAHPPVLADFDEDGSLDLAIGGGGTVTTLLADGAGGFEAPRQTVLVLNAIHFVTPGDVDGDGNLDLVGMHDPRSGIVTYGDGTGGFDDFHQVLTGSSTDGVGGTQVALADLDGDDDPDFLFLAGTLGVLENVHGRPLH